MTRIYSAPFERWNSLGRQALFGAPNFLAFLLYQRLWPLRSEGSFTYDNNGKKSRITFNAKNTQFHSLYFKKFAFGYEPQTSALLDALLPDNGVFYDIGSNWGWFTLLLASKPGFSGQIHAFEPFKPSYLDLCSVVQQASLTDRVHAHQLALSDRVGMAVMRLPDKFQSGQAILDEQAGGEGTATGTLDSLELPAPSVIKADVEGVETKVFKGGQKLFAEKKPMLVFENSRRADDPWSTLEPLAFLASIGYEFFHAGWLRENQGKSFIIGDDNDPEPKQKETLALVPFQWQDRLLRYDGVNVFACHRDRLPELKQLFSERQL